MTMTLAMGLPAASSARPQQPPPTPAPGLDSSRPAPGREGSGRSGAAPALDFRPAPPADEPNADNANRYRLIESYGPPEAPGQDIGSFRVAFVEVLDQAIEAAGAAPRRTRLGARVVYTARPAIVGGLDRRDVSALVRHYDSVQVNRDGQDVTEPLGPFGLNGQTLWVQEQGGPAPTILTLPGSPPLTQEQLGFAAYQQVYVPKLSGLLSPLHVGVGSSWTIEKLPSEALVGDVIRDGVLEGTLEDVLPPGEGEALSRAVVRVTGRLQLVNSQSVVNARLEFAFKDPNPAGDAPAGPVASLDPTLIDARGAIVRLLLAQRDLIEFPDPDGRIASRATQLRELNLERRLDLAGAPVPSLPSPPPSPTPENSWVVYQDPDNLFRFRHPQEFRPAPIQPMGGQTLNLQRYSLGGVPDDLTVVFVPRGQESLEIRPEDFSRRISEVWKSVPDTQYGVTVGRGAEGFLPEQDWPGKRVFRVELPLTYRPSPYSLDEVGQAFFSAYLAQLANGSVVELEAMTEGTPSEFRAEVEAILRSFEADPPAPRGSSPAAGSGAGAGAASSPAPTTPAPAAPPATDIPAPAAAPGDAPGGIDLPPPDRASPPPPFE
jgi:hypothetical protein